MPRQITSATSLENLKKEAKRWLRELRSGDESAFARMRRAWPKAPASPVLRDVQHALALEHGHAGWTALKQALAERPIARADEAAVGNVGAADITTYQALAADLVAAHDQRDPAALERLNQHYGRAFSFDDLFGEIWRRVYGFRQRSSQGPKNYLALEEAQMLVAQDVGYSSWSALAHALGSAQPPVPAFAVDDEEEKRITPRRRLNSADWDGLIAAARELRVTHLDAVGLMSDELIRRIASLDDITGLRLGGSHQLSDDGLLMLARMPQLQRLNLSEYPGGKITDRGMEVLRHLPNLRHFEMAWQRGITDAGVANLRHCEQLEEVNLMGTRTGDGAIETLRGKPGLRRLATGRLVTDAGLARLHDFPQFKKWHGPAITSATQETVAQGTRLLIDGPFTDAGVAGMAGLEGIFELVLFWHTTAITPDGLRSLRGLPNLGALGCDGALSDDVAMRHFAALPCLRRLAAQGTVATDEGFIALSRSPTLEQLWTRETPNLTGRGFRALSTMPGLHSLGVSCKKVDDAALRTLPSFAALREITPIDVHDDGFRHIGRCDSLERLTCMYCRDTTDTATEHIRSLRLRFYYAGLTEITDHSLEILGRMPSLEQIELFECKGVTDAGLSHLARLPRLREVRFAGLPQVTFGGSQVFPPGVRVKYSTG